MYELIISNYVNNLTKNNILDFSFKNNINLNNQELDYIYNIIKSHYKDLLNDKYEYILNDSKKYLSSENHKKICILFTEYRNKFKDFLK